MRDKHGRTVSRKRPPDKNHYSVFVNINSKTIWKTSHNSRRTQRIFQGAAVDTGAELSVIGMAQAKAYCQYHGIRFNLKPSSVKFKFGDGGFPSEGTLLVRIPTPDGSFIALRIDVVQADIPMLLGLDVMDREKLVANNVLNELQSYNNGWKMPLVRKLGHMYLCWSSKSVLFTKKELIKLHRHFRHPSAGKLFNLIRTARPNQADPATRELLETITKSCQTCETFAIPPQRFRVSIPPSDIVFNRDVAMDVMWIDKKAALHIVDIETHFSAASFLKQQTVESVWDAFITCWASLYTGFPMKLRVDQGSSFTSVRWTKRCEHVGTIVQTSGVESHNSIGNGERYHAPLRRIFNKVKYENPKMDRNVALKLAVKACNDTLGPEGLVPSVLVFGCMPRFPSVDSTIPAQKERMLALQEARKEMATITAELRLKKALLSKVPRNADLTVETGDMVRIYRETDKKYIGPFPVIRMDGKQVYVIQNDREVQYSLHQILPAVKYDSMVNGTYVTDILRAVTPSLKSSIKTKDTDSTAKVMITEILHRSDPRTQTPEAAIARRKEIENLVRRGTWELVLEEQVPPDANVISGSFVITIKNVETTEPMFKARFVAHGNRDSEKYQLVHNITTTRPSSVRLLVAIASIMGFDIWSEDISQAYLQSASVLLRDVYMKPNRHLSIPAGHLLKILRPLYGLADSGDYWHATFAKHLKNTLGMSNVASDMSLFFRKARGRLTGLTASYVDDTLACGDASFLKLSGKTRETFDVQKRVTENIRFAGTYIDKHENGYKVHQRQYVERLTEISKNADFAELRRARAQLSWLVHSRPDICVVANKLAQVTEKLFSEKHVKLYNSSVKYLKATNKTAMVMRQLDKDSLHIRAYADASFATNYDQTSQLGYIIALCDKFDNASILHFQSYKSRRVARSVLGAETYAFADAFDFAFCTKQDIELVMGRDIPLMMFTDSKSLFDIITKCSHTQEKRLMIDLQAVRDAYESHEISNVGFIRGPNNPADGLTKIGKCPPLSHLLQTGRANFQVEQYILRNSSKKYGN